MWMYSSNKSGMSLFYPKNPLYLNDQSPTFPFNLDLFNDSRMGSNRCLNRSDHAVSGQPFIIGNCAAERKKHRNYCEHGEAGHDFHSNLHQ